MTVVAVSVYFGSFLKNSIKLVRRNRIAIHSLLVERLSSLSMIRAMGREGREVARINKQARKLEKNIAKQGVFLGLLRGIGDSSSLILISVFFVFNGLNNHVLALDEITALVSIILFLNSPIRELGRLQEYYQGAKLSISKIQELYAIPRIVRGKSSLKAINENSVSLGRIIFRDVKVGGIFNHLTVNAKKGEHIALTGTNGSGKSTLIQVILGLIKVDTGLVRVNGNLPNKTSSPDRAGYIGYASAEAGLIRGSLFDNLTYRKSKNQIKGLDELLSFCQLNDLVKKLPKGLNTKVLEKGKNLSSGEKARILLFRALLGNPAILILDEPESYLDKQGLEIIKNLLTEYKGTILMATHNIELIKLCHKEWNVDMLKKKQSPVRLINDYAKK
jgi:ABC-type bacteriocin/lantibiotic exporter with double-glycine peptidase domain